MPGVGNAFRLTGTFTQAGTPTDPAGAVSLIVTSPLGNVQTFTSGFAHTPGSGIYSFDFLPTMSGVWTEEWKSDVGAGQADTVRLFVVEGAGLYCFLADLRAMGIPTTVDDNTVADHIEIASRIVDDYCVGHAPFGSQIRTVTVDDVRDQTVILPQPFSGVTQVAVNGNPLSQTVSTVAASPAPTTTTFTLATGTGSTFSTSDLLYIAGAPAQPLSIVGDAVTLAAPLAQAPSAGTAVVQPTGYRIETWGIRLLSGGYWIAPDSWPVSTGSPYTSALAYGARIEVTATFGDPMVPSVVRGATRLVTARLLAAISEERLDGRITALSVEGYSVRFADPSAAGLATTGVPEADRMLMRYRDPVLA